MNNIPATATSELNNNSYDCKITNNFGNTLGINISCPTIKVIENIVSQLPKSNEFQNILFALSLIIISIYYYLRTNQLAKEVHIIRKDITTGTI